MKCITGEHWFTVKLTEIKVRAIYTETFDTYSYFSTKIILGQLILEIVCSIVIIKSLTVHFKVKN